VHEPAIANRDLAEDVAMSLQSDLGKRLVSAAREGAAKLVKEQVDIVRAEMGDRGRGLTYKWVEATGSSLDKLGRLRVTGPSDDVVAEFNDRLQKKRMKR